MNIAIIGVGALGYRHLQSLYELKDKYKIYVVEVKTEAIKTILEEMPEVNGVTNISQLPSELEVVVISTGADVRREVFENLVNHRKVKNIIFEKVLFQREEDYIYVQHRLKELGTNAWVNCARREWGSYRAFKEEVSEAREIYFSAVGGDWGLGCNGIHMLDLVEYLSGDNVEEISVDKLENKIIESKRKGYYEFCGMLAGKAGRCKNFTITSISNSSLPFIIEVVTEKARYMIDESHNKITIFSEKTGWAGRESVFKQVYQSQMTGRVVKSIIDNGTCNLTDYNSAIELHLKYIRPLIQFFNRNGMEGDLCPIT